ncbi:MAG TPA: tryptophan synthase subunit alpha [Ignavibacteriaceae bacterium]|nr:tryptophan synthase subunit alpha [Ignavibacteriaceae bacterium]
MSYISDFIKEKNNKNEKVLSVFLTAGFPHKENFVQMSLDVLDAGADILEIGFPFSDPLADGPTIQHSSFEALQQGINIQAALSFVEKIREKSDKPLILMGYANPVLKYGLNRFASDAKKSGVNGLIIPDVPIDEYYNFFNSSFTDLDIVLLATPTTPDERIKMLDELSKGFLYYVSMTGTTGKHLSDKSQIQKQLKKVSGLVTKNPLLIGFGISSPEDVKMFAPYCSGVIVGSAVIKSLMNTNGSYRNSIALVKELKEALNFIKV